MDPHWLFILAKVLNTGAQTGGTERFLAVALDLALAAYRAGYGDPLTLGGVFWVFGHRWGGRGGRNFVGSKSSGAVVCIRLRGFCYKLMWFGILFS